ncbi:hypothetical protein VTN77DRAFT_2718 [Rasamsonia byssochlamydoides]|uniref:uncharacterized protein n=1 Tax=Rasamsonia byssochlamydoides TaxID=89139 RepID=UPI003741F920
MPDLRQPIIKLVVLCGLFSGVPRMDFNTFAQMELSSAVACVYILSALSAYQILIVFFRKRIVNLAIPNYQ